MSAESTLPRPRSEVGAGASRCLRTSEEIYRLRHWGAGYFSVGRRGNVSVHPRRDPDVACDLVGIIEGLQERGITTPVVVRFSDILEDRLRYLRRAFDDALRESEYRGAYHCLYPLKVNQQRHVCEEIRDLAYS